MSTSNPAIVASAPPTLAPPGAGIPNFERLIGKTMFTFTHAFGSPAKNEAKIESERDAILQIVNAHTPEQCSQPALIPRLPGLEDSSRYWSVYMTLEHLHICNFLFADIITGLGAGHVPANAADTATVKPGPDIDSSVIPKFTESCNAVVAAAKALPNLRTAAKYSHPWFGPFDAARWYTITAFHIPLHKKQIQLILKNLK